MPKKEPQKKTDAFSRIRETIREAFARVHGGGVIENVVTPILKGAAGKKKK